MKQAFVLLATFVATLLLSSGNSYGQKKDTLKSKWVSVTGINYRVQNGDTTWYNPKTGAQISKWTADNPIISKQPSVQLGGKLIHGKLIHSDTINLKLKWADATKAHRDTMVITPTNDADTHSILWQMIKDGHAPATGIGSTLEFYPNQDTVKVIMLVCDTSSYPAYGRVAAVILDNDRKLYYDIKDRVPAVWWQFGYEVLVGDGRFYEYYTPGQLIPSIQETHSLKEYLDQNKKPLSKSIVVFLTKEIKN